jgi:hypothetical protein
LCPPPDCDNKNAFTEIKIKDEKEDITIILMKSRGSLENTFKTYIQLNWKI